MKLIEKLTWRSRPLDAHITVCFNGTLDDYKQHEGTLIDLQDDDSGMPLHAAWLWNDTEQALIAVVFDRQRWTPKQAEAFVAEALATAKQFTQGELLMPNGNKRAIVGSTRAPRHFVGGAREAEARRILRELGVEAVRTSLTEHGEALDQFSPGFQSDFLATELKEYAYAAAGIVDSADVAALVNRVKGNVQASSKRQAVASPDVRSLIDRVRGRKAAGRDVQQFVQTIKPDATSKE